mmetsp:Transcript_27748/g.82767  ORF Transcript_27748/g.82767 Transcript_27748/m.82767 type:complete len:284 (-) Transcript_27748:84-935(-)
MLRARVLSELRDRLALRADDLAHALRRQLQRERAQEDRGEVADRAKDVGQAGAPHFDGTIARPHHHRGPNLQGRQEAAEARRGERRQEEAAQQAAGCLPLALGGEANAEVPAPRRQADGLPARAVVALPAHSVEPQLRHGFLRLVGRPSVLEVQQHPAVGELKHHVSRGDGPQAVQVRGFAPGVPHRGHEEGRLPGRPRVRRPASAGPELPAVVPEDAFEQSGRDLDPRLGRDATQPRPDVPPVPRPARRQLATEDAVQQPLAARAQKVQDLLPNLLCAGRGG